VPILPPPPPSHLLLQNSDDVGSDDDLEDPVLFQCVATHAYKGQYEDELSFKAGDRVEVTADSKLGTVLCKRW
jgi:hypothetical protein